jgi:hypothetical protein
VDFAATLIAHVATFPSTIASNVYFIFLRSFEQAGRKLLAGRSEHIASRRGIQPRGPAGPQKLSKEQVSLYKSMADGRVFFLVAFLVYDKILIIQSPLFFREIQNRGSWKIPSNDENSRDR